MQNETEVRQTIVEAGRRLAARFFVASNDGNISARLDENAILITPTLVNKGDLTPDQIIKVGLDGSLLAGYLKPSSEMKMHLAAYRLRPDIRAVVHAHPPAATAFAVSGEKLDDPLILPEALFSLGKVGYCPYATPSTYEVPASIEGAVMESDALLLSNHGALTLGDSVMAAYYRMENLEMVSRITLAARLLGKARVIEGENIEKLSRVKEEQGWGRPETAPQKAASEKAQSEKSGLDVDRLALKIAQMINAQLK